MEKNRITILVEEKVDLSGIETWKDVVCLPDGWFTFTIPFESSEKLIEYKERTPLTPQKCLAADFIIRGSVDN